MKLSIQTCGTYFKKYWTYVYIRIMLIWFFFPNDINGRLHNLSEHIIESKFKLSLNIGWIQVVEKLCQTLFWAKKWSRLILDWEPLNWSTLCNKTSYRTRINSHGRRVFLTYLMWGHRKCGFSASPMRGGIGDMFLQTRCWHQNFAAIIFAQRIEPRGGFLRKADSPFGPRWFVGLVKAGVSRVKAYSGGGQRWLSNKLQVQREDDVVR